ncbi:hypothetical protein AVEN_27526-1 [Araneus ventricosus]|uniref:Uncharacterized protein n=1 Tax=Araneus ventricosus TaxID=182803 RepID=A0A4Y2JB41_ARAVE|nr:hypothetical protein AVEN_27526-1 [Araneus ventricosus]
MFPYLFQHIQMLQAEEHQLLLDFTNGFLIRYNADNSRPLRIRWADEAHFSLTDNVNSKNCVHWAVSNPNDVVTLPLHEEKVTVWCGMTNASPHFFQKIIYFPRSVDVYGNE